jgi:NADPH-dependent 2,4-dienoyl-CoA reductase/sulfur reductase-like enzyme
MTSRVVIVGASLGGLRTAEQLRGRGFEGEITVVGDEPHPPYNRPPLSKEALSSGVADASIVLPPRLPLEPVEWRLGCAAAAVDLSAQTLTLADGTDIAYDALVVASGVRPRRLGILAGLPNTFVLRTIGDAKQLRGVLRRGVRLAIVGSGFLGCEVAASARKLGCEVSVITREAAPLASAIGEGIANAILARHRSEGVCFYLGDQVTAAENGGESLPTSLFLESGRVVEADVVLEAIGGIPNVEWLQDNGIDLADGALCKETLEVNDVKNVYAVGDVARFANLRFDEVPRRVEHWNMAIEAARHVAAAITSREGSSPPPFRPLPSFWSNQYDLRLQAFGMPRIADTIRVLDEEVGGTPVTGFYRGESLVAVAALANGPRLIELAQGTGMITAVS